MKIDCTNYNYLANLNKEQEEAVTHINGALMVCAGAGSGKTRVITYRIIHLIKKHSVDPNSILAVTFTNKAANEMKERVKTLLTGEIYFPLITTFHGFALRMLKSYPKKEYSTWGILDDQDQTILMSKIFKEYKVNNTNLTPKKVLAYISKVANGMIQESENTERNIYSELAELYKKEKLISRVFDFDDLLNIFNELLNCPIFLNIMNNKFRHILIDEYQDTNLIQHSIIKKLTINKEKNLIIDSLCIVGDEDQSIYSWRGAQVSNIIDFSKEINTIKSILITKNYRSVSPILKTANNVIANNTIRNPKELTSEKNGERRVFIFSTASGFQEADAVLELIQLIKKNNTLSNFDCAILYRAHYQSRLFEESFLRYAIPYKIVGGIQFYDRLEIKDMIAYLKLINNPFDQTAFLRIYNTPNRGLGNAFESTFYSAFNKHNGEKSILEILVELTTYKEITERTKRGLIELISILKKVEEHKDNTLDALEEIITLSNYIEYIKKISENVKESEERIQNIKELCNALSYRNQTSLISISIFLEEIALINDLQNEHEKKTDSSSVKMMSFHAAKGLEFDNVILVGLEEGILPSSKSFYSPNDLEEERRLLYVGITRAKEYLYCFYAKSRYMFSGLQTQQKSRLLDEFPAALTIKVDISSTPNYVIKKKMYDSLYENEPTKNFFEKKIDRFNERESFINKKSLFVPGEKISHDIFGKGVVIKSEEILDKCFLTIKFDTQIEYKKIISQFIKKF